MGLFDFLLFNAVTSNGNKRRENNSSGYDNNGYDSGYEDGYYDSCDNHDCDCNCDSYDCDDSCDCDW